MSVHFGRTIIHITNNPQEREKDEKDNTELLKSIRDSIMHFKIGNYMGLPHDTYTAICQVEQEDLPITNKVDSTSLCIDHPSSQTETILTNMVLAPLLVFSKIAPQKIKVETDNQSVLVNTKAALQNNGVELNVSFRDEQS